MATGESPTTTSGTGSGSKERLGGRSSGSKNKRDGPTRTMVTDQISQAVVSTSNLIHLMLQSSPSQAQLIKLPRNLLAKTTTIKSTEQVLEQLPRVIASLDAHMETGLQSVAHLKTVTQLLTNIETCQLKSLSKAQLSSGDPEGVHQPPEAG